MGMRKFLVLEFSEPCGSNSFLYKSRNIILYITGQKEAFRVGGHKYVIGLFTLTLLSKLDLNWVETVQNRVKINEYDFIQSPINLVGSPRNSLELSISFVFQIKSCYKTEFNPGDFFLETEVTTIYCTWDSYNLLPPEHELLYHIHAEKTESSSY